MSNNDERLAAIAARDQAWAGLAEYEADLQRISEVGVQSESDMAMLMATLHAVLGELIMRRNGDAT